MDELAGQVLRRGGRLRIKARGDSMLPFLRDGDIVLVAPTGGGGVTVGDVVCYETSPGRLFLHRVIARRRESFVAKGDALAFTDVIERAQLLGRVVAVERHGRVRRLDTRAARWLNRVIATASPLLPRLVLLAIRLRRAWGAAGRG